MPDQPTENSPESADKPPAPPNAGGAGLGSPSGNGGSGSGSGFGNGAGSGVRPASRRSDRDLINDALNQASPRPETVDFLGKGVLSDTFPGYDILREIHRGGQGVVYLALQRTTKRKVAIKVIHGGPFTGSSGKARFEREVQILGQLNHPNIVGIHDSGVTTDGSFFYVMDYISGKSLDEVLRESQRPPIDQTLKLFIKICDAVNAAHLKGVIHRDLKPSNIRIDTSGEPIVVDFGLAKVATPDLSGDEQDRMMTVTGQFIGSLPWASPEQAEGVPAAIDVRTDVYSLGVVLYQMLTGKFPYQVVGNMRDVLNNILKAQPSPPSTVRRQINNEVETIVLKCLSKERERRYQSAGELARDLRHYLDGEPIEAKRDSGLYFITKTLQRHKVFVGVATLFAITVIGFGIVMAVLYQKAETARQKAQTAQESAEAAQSAEKAARDLAAKNARMVFAFGTKYTFDAADRVSVIQGGTPTLILLIKGLVEQFEALEPQIQGDREMMRTLAKAFDTLSGYQSDLYTGRVGDEADAQRYHEHALRIRRSLLAQSPDVWYAHLDVALSLYRGAMMAQGKRDYQATFDQLGSAIEEFDKASALAAKAPAEPAEDLFLCNKARMQAMRARCWAMIRMAEDSKRESFKDLDISDGRIADAQALFKETEPKIAELVSSARARAAIADHDLSTAAAIPGEQSKMLATAAQTRKDAAERLLAEGRAQLATLWDEWAKSYVLLADNRKRAAELGVHAGDVASAKAQYEKALAPLSDAQALASKAIAEFEALLIADPKGAQRQADLYVANYAMGEAAGQRAKIRESAEQHAQMKEFGAGSRAEHGKALDFFKAALTYAENAHNSDPTRLNFSRDLAIALVRVGDELIGLDDPSAAAVHYDNSLVLRREIFHYDRVNRHKRDLALGLYKVAQVSRKLGRGAAGLAADQAWAKADRSIVEARMLFEQLMNDNPGRYAGDVNEALREQASLWMDRGMAEKKAGNKDEAEKFFAMAVANLTFAGDPLGPRPEDATLARLKAITEGPK